MTPMEISFLFNEIRFWSSSIQVVFWHVGREVNVVDILAKQGG